MIVKCVAANKTDYFYIMEINKDNSGLTMVALKNYSKQDSPIFCLRLIWLHTGDTFTYEDSEWTMLNLDQYLYYMDVTQKHEIMGKDDLKHMVKFQCDVCKNYNGDYCRIKCKFNENMECINFKKQIGLVEWFKSKLK